MSSSKYPVDDTGPVLLGREDEIAALRALAPGQSRPPAAALVLRGEAGAGKTALLAEFARHAAGHRARPGVLRVDGIAAETAMAWAALHRLLLALPGEPGRLADERRALLDAAFGLRAGVVPQAPLVREAALSVLADAAREYGLVCVIDDLQWIDRKTLAVLHEAARRGRVLPLVLVAAAAEAAPVPVLAGLPELRVDGLAPAAGTELLLTLAPRYSTAAARSCWPGWPSATRWP
jgi:hypothetical protein